MALRECKQILELPKKGKETSAIIATKVKGITVSTLWCLGTSTKVRNISLLDLQWFQPNLDRVINQKIQDNFKRFWNPMLRELKKSIVHRQG